MKTLFILNDAPYGGECSYNALRLAGALGKETQAGKVSACHSCMEARGMSDAELSEGSTRGSLAQLAEWTEWADKVLVF